MDKTDTKKEKVTKNESLINVNFNRRKLKIEILEKIVLILLIFKIKRQSVKRKIKLSALKVIMKRGVV
tara:strand:+ start:331 stop:534 length:204 start_codon:yes stop_codon:yes gene_type:complete